MMTGLTIPTSGDVEIMGSSIVHHPQAARRHLGYCPQSNVLFGSLTVEEHLIIYGAIKGIPGGPFSPASYKAADEAIQVPPHPSAAAFLTLLWQIYMSNSSQNISQSLAKYTSVICVQLVELGDKRNTPARALSGGMKRRLQVSF
jgi:ABC-type multidrug transport system ATPase subunit